MMYSQSRCFFVLLITVYCAYQTNGNHVITTPRKWAPGEESQICVTLSTDFSTEDSIKISVKPTSNKDKKSTLSVEKELILPQGQKNICDKVLLPETKETVGKLSITGILGGSSLNYSESISIATGVTKTFVQTDKYLYKPGQTVQFRVLTITGPYLQVSDSQYEEIWIQNPSGSRIAQWLDVPNERGLIHLSFKLDEEPEEGSYKISVRSLSKKLFDQTFKVEEYVLPRYEVTATPPKYVLGTSKSFDFEVCAKYTFGQPVKGNVTFTISNNGWGEFKKEIKKEDKISGCKTFTITTEEMPLNNDDYFVYILKAKAVVTEDGTGVELKASEVSVDITRTALEFEDVSVQEVYKPELPFVGEVSVNFPDDSPAPNEPMSVCLLKTCKNMTTNAKGILKFVIPPHLQNDHQIRIKSLNYPLIKSSNSWRSIMYESSFRKTLKKYHSPSNSSLIIAINDDELKCLPSETTIDFEVPVQFTAVQMDSAFVTVQVISRGQIQFSKSIQQPLSSGSPLHFEENILLEPLREPVTKNSVRGQFVIPVNLPKTVSPDAKIVVWYATKSGEVVSDSRNLDISECLLNSVSLTWSADKLQPGETASLSIAAEPFSLCSLGVVDKSVQLLSAKENPLTVKALLGVAKNFAIGRHERSQVDDHEYCRNKETTTDVPPPLLPPVALPMPPEARKRRSFHPWLPYYSIDIDALHMFDKAGLYVFSDMTLETRPCKRRYGPYYDDYDLIDLPRKPVAFSGVLFDSPSQATNKNTGSPPLNEESPTSKSDQNNPRTYFPETWLWQLFSIAESGIINQPLTLPDTVTEWVGNAVCVHGTKGVGISSPSSITTFRDFFADLTLPPTVKRGEIFPVKISVFNYLKEPLPLKVILEESPEYDILSDLNDELGSGERSSCIPAEDKSVHPIRIRPKEVGKVNITVQAFIDINAVETEENYCSGIMKLLNFTSGKDKRDILIKPIQVEIEGFLKEKVWSKYVCTDELESNKENTGKIRIETPPVIVPDSARAFITVGGDLMGPTLDNLGSLVKMPYGCGEQNMLNFAPNIFVMQYLDASNQNNEEIAGNAINYMEKGYQRELNYRHSDGSYSAFGSRDASGSTWLTAFVLKSFAQARSYISIDVEDLSVSKEWLKQRQLENGCFESVGKVLHKGMKGGLKGSDSPALLSAFVLIALIESGESGTSRVVREALFCLNADEPTKNPYSLAVKAYSFALSGSPDAEQAINNLLAVATEETSIMYWDLPKEFETGKGVGLETASYAVLALLAQGATTNPEYQSKVQKLVKWMNNQRNGQGGFISTQDTIIALQALAEYEKTLPKGPIDATVIAIMDTAEVSFNVNEQNKLLQQKAIIDTVPTSLDVLVEGQGCVLYQAVLRYNIPEPEPKEAFSLRVEASTEPDGGCKTKRITACANYTLEGESNMAIVEVKLASGYIPEKSDLKQLVGYGTGLFKRYEVDGNTVTVYVDAFSSTELCVSFRILREVDVENPKPGSVKVYDYYKPEYAADEKYELPPASECVSDREFIPLEKEIIPFDNGGDGEAVSTLAPGSLGDMIDAFDEAIL